MPTDPSPVGARWGEHAPDGEEMMKKIKKPLRILHLKRERLRALGENDLQKVDGGATTIKTNEFTCSNDCPTG